MGQKPNPLPQTPTRITGAKTDRHFFIRNEDYSK